jgi:high-affinity iron transporter
MLLQLNAIDLLVPLFLAFREGLEAVLVMVIILSYLKATKQQIYAKFAYIGALLAIITSIVFAFLFNLLFGGFTGTAEQIFEGFTFIISGLFIITLILWVSIEGPRMREKLEEKVEFSIESGKIFSISILSFIIILREGIELVLLLTGATSVGAISQSTIILGSLIGLGTSLVIGILTYFGVKTINFSKFLKITNVLLILFAAGLITYGIHELIEANLVNPIIEEVWNLKAILPESFPDENPSTFVGLEIIGSLLKALFGYNANPSLLEVIVYPSLLVVIGIISYYLWNRSPDIQETKEIQEIHKIQ